ncbi:MAG: helix-turn-helix domain-containing protein [Sphingomicrobium sp.]
MEMLPILAQLDEKHPCFGCAVRSSAICAVLDSDDLGHFKRGGSTVHRASGETIFFEGDTATHVYNLTSGVMRLSKLLPDGRRQIAGFLFPGDFLGITMEDEHAFTAEAITPSILCQFSRARFDGFVDSHPHLERRLYAIAAHELAAARQQVVLLGRKTAAERVASFLLMLDARRTGEGLDGDITLPMSRADIADYLGLRIETISRELSALKASRLIRLTTTQTIRFVDREQLEQLAEG